MALPLELVSHPVESAAVDWFQGTYVLHNNDCLDELYAFTHWLADQAFPGGEWSGPSPGKHFTHTLRHPAGISFSYTPRQSAAGVSSGSRNEGFASIEISGRLLASVDAKFRQGLYSDLAALRGFKRCNRLDSQITVLNPEVDALAVVLLVEQRKLWPVGYGRGQAYCERLQSGEIIGAVTQYFGAKTSARRARVYDKAAEQGWPVPAVRFEVQERREAADQHFRQLARLSQTEAKTPPLLVTAEDRTVRNVIGGELDLRDTSAWVDRERPQRWAQYAPVPGWWREVLAQPISPIEVQYRKPVDLALTRAASVDQYGRKVALETLRRCLRDGTELHEEYASYFLDCFARLRRDDLATLLSLLPEDQVDEARELFDGVMADAAAVQEGLATATPDTPRG